jgi:hypothetical protein
MKFQRGFVFPPLLLSPTGIMGMAIAVLLLTNFITYSLYKSEVAAYAQFKADVLTQQEQIRIENERKLAKLSDLNKQATEGWKSALDALGKRGPIRVQPTRCPGVMPAISVAPRAADAATKEPAADRTVTVEACELIANNAVIDTVQLVMLQEWILKAREATK